MTNTNYSNVNSTKLAQNYVRKRLNTIYTQPIHSNVKTFTTENGVYRKLGLQLHSVSLIWKPIARLLINSMVV